MFYRRVFLLCLPVLLGHLDQGGAGRRFSMGCECGIRKVNKEEEEDCDESAKIEAPEGERIIRHCIS